MKRRQRGVHDVSTVSTAVTVGSITLPNPIMTASGTAGHGLELSPYGNLGDLGAFVAKSLASFEWAGNPSPRVHPTPLGMINAVGLQGPGVERWLTDGLPALHATGARVVASIWGRTLDDYAAAAALLADAGPEVIAVEVNLSCPNLEGRRGIFAHDPDLSARVIAATVACGRPRWAKLSPNTDRVVEVAAAVHEAGAEAVTLINTVLGMVIDPHTRRPALGNGGGGLSGRAIHPVAVRIVHDVREALPDLAIIGVGGVASGWDAAELMIAGAAAVQVGTATFADPKAPWVVLGELRAWAASEGISSLAELTDTLR
ncbi:MAG: dihydroorotate dehydrogenase [Ilumatobacteraceae bacterium]